MLKDLTLKNWFELLLVTLGVVILTVYIDDNQESVAPLLKTFSLTPETAKGILIFSVAFYLIIGLIADYLISPFVFLTEKREQETIFKIKDAEKISLKIEELDEDFLRHVSEEKRSAMMQKAVIMSEARSRAEKIVFNTENEISTDIASSKDRIEKKASDYLRELQAIKQELTSVLKNKILGL